ncbi:unnamed protein product [Urochloa humidicola]
MEPSPPRSGHRGRIGMATQLWLVDELIEEVFLRFPADDPALLFRAALVCKRWRRLVSDPGFRRREEWCFLSKIRPRACASGE